MFRFVICRCYTIFKGSLKLATVKTSEKNKQVGQILKHSSFISSLNHSEQEKMEKMEGIHMGELIERWRDSDLRKSRYKLLEVSLTYFHVKHIAHAICFYFVSIACL